jgi:hypothetical protein
VASNRKSLKERANYCFFAEAEIAAVRPENDMEQNGIKNVINGGTWQKRQSAISGVIIVVCSLKQKNICFKRTLIFLSKFNVKYD